MLALSILVISLLRAIQELSFHHLRLLAKLLKLFSQHRCSGLVELIRKGILLIILVLLLLHNNSGWNSQSTRVIMLLH